MALTRRRKSFAPASGLLQNGRARRRFVPVARFFVEAATCAEWR